MIQRNCCGFVMLVLVAWLAGPISAHAEMELSTELARVDNDPITYLNLLKYAKANRALKSQPVTDHQEIESLIDGLIFDAVARREALKVDLSNNWHYRNILRKALTVVAAQLYYDEVLAPQIQIDSTSIDSFYRAHLERYTVPVKQRHVEQITVYKSGKGVPAGYITQLDSTYMGWDPKRKIDSLYTRLANGEDFAHLAYLFSEEPRARATSGDWGWVSETGISDTILSRIIFEQPLHRISKPIELSYGWVIIHVLGEREAGATPRDVTVLDDIRDQLIRQFGRSLTSHLVDSLAGLTQLQYVDRVMSFPDSELTWSEPMAIVNQRDTIRAVDYLLYKAAKEVLREIPNLTPAKRREVVVTIARSVALYQALREWGYLDRPEVEAARQKQRIQGGVDQIMNDALKMHDPTPAEIEKYYNDHIREFTPAKRHFIQYRQFTDADSATSLADNWRNGRPPDWADTRWVGPEDVPNTVWNRIAGVPPGTVIGPLHVGAAYWVISLERIAKPKSLGEMRATIISQLRDQQIADSRARWLRSVASRHTIVRHEQRIAEVVLPSVVDAEALMKTVPSTESIEKGTLFDE